jgi:hypothetical protein
LADEEDSAIRVFLFGIGRDKLETAAAGMGMMVEVAQELKRADAVLTTKTHYRRGSQLVRIAESQGTPVYVLRKNTMPQVEEFLKTLNREAGSYGDRDYVQGGDSEAILEQAMSEAEEAANRVVGGESKVKLSPQRSYVRRLQHILGQRYNLASVSQGRDPNRAVVFYKA